MEFPESPSSLPTTRPQIGCVGFGRSLSHYAASLSFVELAETLLHAPRASTLARWRQAVPASFVFALRAQQLVTHGAGHPAFARLPQTWQHRGKGALPFFPTSLALAALDDTLGAAEQLSSTVIVFETPASFRPTATNRQRLEAFFSRAPRPKVRFVWHPLGLWQTPEVGAICRDLGLIAACDPLLEESAVAAAAGASVAYFRLGQPTYRTSDLFQLSELFAPDAAGEPLAEQSTEQFFVFPNPASFSQAVALQRLFVGPAT